MRMKERYEIEGQHHRWQVYRVTSTADFKLRVRVASRNTRRGASEVAKALEAKIYEVMHTVAV